MRHEWDRYVISLNIMGITLTSRADLFLWYYNKVDGVVTSKLVYDYLSAMKNVNLSKWWGHSIWSWNVPLKIKCFIWLVLHNRILTWDNLRRRDWKGSGICSLCRTNMESIPHLFIQCSFA